MEKNEEKALIKRYYDALDNYFNHDSITHEQMHNEIQIVFDRLAIIGCSDVELKKLVDYHIFKKTLTPEQLINEKLQRLDEIKEVIGLEYYEKHRKELLDKLAKITLS